MILWTTIAIFAGASLLGLSVYALLVPPRRPVLLCVGGILAGLGGCAFSFHTRPLLWQALLYGGILLILVSGLLRQRAHA